MHPNLKGLLKTHKEFVFLKNSDLLRYYLENFFPKSIIAVIYDAKTAIESVPKLSILKRDNYIAYIKALNSDIVLAEFQSVTEAEDWLFSFRMNLKWEIYKNKKLIRNEKGKIHGKRI